MIDTDELERADRMVRASGTIATDARSGHEFITKSAGFAKEPMENIVMHYTERADRMIGPFNVEQKSSLAVLLRHVLAVGAVAARLEKERKDG